MSLNISKEHHCYGNCSGPRIIEIGIVIHTLLQRCVAPFDTCVIHVPLKPFSYINSVKKVTIFTTCSTCRHFFPSCTDQFLNTIQSAEPSSPATTCLKFALLSIFASAK